MNSAPAIELAGIDKRFGAVHANCDVSLRVAAGTVHGIVGENGAGKSTLMSILYGFYEADRGEIRIDGRPVTIRSTRSEEHTSELQSLMRISYAVFCLKKKTQPN